MEFELEVNGIFCFFVWWFVLFVAFCVVSLKKVSTAKVVFAVLILLS